MTHDVTFESWPLFNLSMNLMAMPFRLTGFVRVFDAPHFARWFNTLTIGSLGIRIRPASGWSSSKIRKTAHATENAEATKASVVVALGGATRLKPKKITTSHETSAINNGLEMDGIACACNNDRSWPRSTMRVTT